MIHDLHKNVWSIYLIQMKQFVAGFSDCPHFLFATQLSYLWSSCPIHVFEIYFNTFVVVDITVHFISWSWFNLLVVTLLNVLLSYDVRKWYFQTISSSLNMYKNNIKNNREVLTYIIIFKKIFAMIFDN